MSDTEPRPTLDAQPEGKPGVCKGPSCGATIYWKPLREGGPLHPCNADKTSHFSTCPDAKSFRRKKK